MTIRTILLILSALLFPCIIFPQIVTNSINDLTSSKDSIPKKTLSTTPQTTQSIKHILGGEVGNMKGKYVNGSFKAVKKEVDQLFNSPFRFDNASLDYLSSFDTSLIGSNSSYYRHDISISGDAAFFGIPLTIQFIQRNYADAFNYGQQVFTVRFDKDGYLQALKNRMADRFNPQSMVADIEQSIHDIKSKAIANLKDEMQSINNEAKGMVKGEVQAILQRKDLFYQDITSLRQSFFNSSAIEEEHSTQALLSSLLHKINTGEFVDSSELINVHAQLQKQKAVCALIDKIEQYRNKWNSSGLLKQIKGLELLKKSNLQQLATDPSFIRSQAKKYLSLKGVQKFFLNMNRLHLGQDAVTTGAMSFHHFLHSGISTEFLNAKSKSVLLVLGRQKDFNSLFDYRFTQTLVSNAGQVTAGRFSLKSLPTAKSAISISNFNQIVQNGISTGVPFFENNFRQILVTTLSNEISIGKKGAIHLDLSRSATSYRGNSPGTDSTLKQQNNLSQLVNGRNIWDNTAFALSYSDEVKDKGLSYRVNFSKTANGYTNPGNSFLAGGSVEAGGHVRKNFLKEKLQFSLRGNLRHYKFGDQTLYRWINLYWVTDIKWKYSKGQYISLRYQPNRMLRISSGDREMINYSDRLTADISVARKIGKINYRNFISLVFQDTRFIVSANEKITAKSLQINSFQSILLKKGAIAINASYIYSDNSSQYVYFNSSLNADAGYNYILFKKVYLFTGIVYSQTKDWYSQLGIRQSFSGQLNEHFNISAYVDARKNLSLYQPLWNSPVRGDISLKYLFKRSK